MKVGDIIFTSGMVCEVTEFGSADDFGFTVINGAWNGRVHQSVMTVLGGPSGDESYPAPKFTWLGSPPAKVRWHDYRDMYEWARERAKRPAIVRALYPVVDRSRALLTRCKRAWIAAMRELRDEKTCLIDDTIPF